MKSYRRFLLRFQMNIDILKIVILENDFYFVYVYRYGKRYFIMDYAKVALEKHLQWKGKIEIVPTCPVETKMIFHCLYTGCSCTVYTNS